MSRLTNAALMAAYRRGFEIRKPVDCYLFGKITDRVGAALIPIEDFFRAVVDDVLPAALGVDVDPLLDGAVRSFPGSGPPPRRGVFTCGDRVRCRSPGRHPDAVADPSRDSSGPVPIAS